MFDSIITDWKCKDCGYIAKKEEFQTKALNCSLFEYKLGDEIYLPSIETKNFNFTCSADNVHLCNKTWYDFDIDAKAIVKNQILKEIKETEIKKTKIYIMEKKGSDIRFANLEGDATFWYNTKKKIGGWASVGGKIEDWHPKD